MESKTPTQAHHPRVESILRCAETLLAEQGSLNIRIADIAKGAGVSVGTFYTHFESKEDLILALVCQSTRMRRARFEESFADSNLDCVGKIIVGMLRNFLFGGENPGLFAAEELSSMRSIWEAASEQQVGALRQELYQLGTTFRKQALMAIESGHLKPWADPIHQAAQLDKGAWILMSGCTYVYRTVLLLEEEPLGRPALPDAMLSSLAAMLSGFGWISDDPNQQVENYAQTALV